jgi:hypothetical protein
MQRQLPSRLLIACLSTHPPTHPPTHPTFLPPLPLSQILHVHPPSPPTPQNTHTGPLPGFVPILCLLNPQCNNCVNTQVPSLASHLDWILASVSLAVVGLLWPLDDSSPGDRRLMHSRQGLPNSAHPSDHLPLGVKLRLLPSGALQE